MQCERNPTCSTSRTSCGCAATSACVMPDDSSIARHSGGSPCASVTLIKQGQCKQNWQCRAESTHSKPGGRSRVHLHVHVVLEVERPTDADVGRCRLGTLCSQQNVRLAHGILEQIQQDPHQHEIRHKSLVQSAEQHAPTCETALVAQRAQLQTRWREQHLWLLQQAEAPKPTHQEGPVKQRGLEVTMERFRIHISPWPLRSRTLHESKRKLI